MINIKPHVLLYIGGTLYNYIGPLPQSFPGLYMFLEKGGKITTESLAKYVESNFLLGGETLFVKKMFYEKYLGEDNRLVLLQPQAENIILGRLLLFINLIVKP